MARKVPDDFRSLPDKTHDALAKTKNMSSNQAYRYVRKLKVPIVTSMGDIRKINKLKSRKAKVPIILSTKEFRGQHKNADGLAFDDKKIVIHPINQYSTKKHISHLIDHEIDHIEVFRKFKKYHKQ
jgi:uncharacterized protein YjaZ